MLTDTELDAINRNPGWIAGDVCEWPIFRQLITQAREANRTAAALDAASEALQKIHPLGDKKWFGRLELAAAIADLEFLRRDHEAMQVLANFPNDGLTIRGDRHTWYVQNDKGGRCGPIANSPTDALLAWKEKYGGREAGDG